MAFTSFFVVGGVGADINAGSTTGAAPNAAATGGSWTNASNTFVATGGTPFAGANVGDYVSVYVDGATVTTYTAQITTVVSDVSVVLSGTIKYGTAPTNGAANRSAVLGGAWNTEQVLAAGGLATFTVPQSTKINIKQATYTITASRTISMAGATTTPLWFSGYNTTPGDLDNDTTNGLSKPIFALNATFLLTTSGTHQIWSGLSVTGSRSGTIWTASGTSALYSRIRSDNTSANAAAFAFSATGTGLYQYCYFKVPSTATTTGVVSVGAGAQVYVGCVADTGGLAGFNSATTTNIVYYNCVAINNTGAGFLSSTGTVRMLNCTVYNSTVDGYKASGTPGATVEIIGCLFVSGSNTMTNGINNASGTNTNLIVRSCNDYFDVTNPEVGMGDSPSFFGQTEGSSPIVSSTDMTPISTSDAYEDGFPGIFENQTYSSFAPIGAVTPIHSVGGSGISGIIGDGSTW